jgi:cyclophilin family peptidyl-prolyl cis-trans isomerase
VEKENPLKKLFIFTLLAILTAFAAIPATLAQDSPRTPAEICADATPADSMVPGQLEGAEDVLQDGVDYQAVFCTTAGPVLVELYETQTPITVNNFVYLAQIGYYNNTNFHRVIPDFMVQGGDPTNTGSGGPGYRFEDEILDELTFNRPGLLAMANAGPGTNGSQFFITTVVTDWLNGNHTIFGEVLAGQPNVENIRLRDPQQSLDPGTLLETVVIIEDPTSVSAEEEVLVPASQEEVIAAFDGLNTYVPILLERFGVSLGGPLGDMFMLADDAGTLLDTAAVVSSMSEDVQAAAESYYADHNHEYALSASIALAECDLSGFPVYELNYRLDAYPTAADAEAALADEALGSIQEAEGFTPYAGDTPVPYAVYTREQNNCDMPTVLARAFQQRGRFVVTQEATITAPNGEIAAFLPEAFTQPLYEDALNQILRPELAPAAVE